MRLSLCAAAIASVTLFQRCVAAPSFRSTGNGNSGDLENPEPPKIDDEEVLKYFHEPGRDDHLGHYDRRFFSKVVNDEERTDTQSHMIRAYLNFFREEGLDTWIAHGTLLGWWWNGKRLPWDTDLDTQVSHATLQHLGKAYNQTRYNYTSPDGNTHREYLLDVNPWIWERVRGDGMNVIDARWIDIRNGLYIDITGLSETRPETQPGVWSCKNYHRYHTTELYPMRETMFEGVLARVPYAYDKILTDEYSESALVITDYNDHVWDPKSKEWVKSSEKMRWDEKARSKREIEHGTKALEQEKLD